VKAVHFTELRTAVGDAYVQAGVTSPSYTAFTIATGVTLIKAINPNELQNGVQALE
jgi:hypothetical protein